MKILLTCITILLIQNITLNSILCKATWDPETSLESILSFSCKFYIFRWCALALHNKLWITSKRVRRLDGSRMCNIRKFTILHTQCWGFLLLKSWPFFQNHSENWKSSKQTLLQFILISNHAYSAREIITVLKVGER